MFCQFLKLLLINVKSKYYEKANSRSHIGNLCFM